MLNPTIAQALSLSTGFTPATSGGKSLVNAFRTLQNFVDTITEGVKLRNYAGNDRTAVVAQAIQDMKSNVESKWAYDLLSKDIAKSQSRDELIAKAKRGEISATILAHLVGKDRKDRKDILSKCGTKSPSGDTTPPATRGQQPSSTVSQRPLAQIVMTTCNVFDQKTASQVVAAMSGASLNGGGNGSSRFGYAEQPISVGAGN